MFWFLNISSRVAGFLVRTKETESQKLTVKIQNNSIIVEVRNGNGLY